MGATVGGVTLLARLFTPPALSRERTLRLTEGIGAWTHLVSSAEYLARERDRAPGGLNDWDVIQGGMWLESRPLRWAVDRVSGRRATRVLHAARIAAAGVLLVPTTGRRPRLVANAFLAGTQLLLHPRHRYGTDGTDQAAFLVQATTTLARTSTRPARVDACLWFLGAQGALAYGISGWAKLLGPAWRDGRALTGVMRTRSYGDEGMWRLLRRYPAGAKVLGAAVLTLESTFPLVYATRGRLAVPYVGAAVAFHLANARVMGLNRFVPAFLSLHPAVLYTAGRQAGRDDLTPRVYAALGVGVLGSVAVTYARQRRVVSRGWADARTYETAAGNRLRYRFTEPVTPAASAGTGSGPVVVLENGLAATAESWAYVRDRLVGRAPVLTYDRAGYGGSTAVGATDLDGAVDDLVGLVRHVAGDRRVLLAGHSLGGYLVWRAAERLGDQVTALVLADPSHPEELRRSPAQLSGAEMFDPFLVSMATSTRIGLGFLVRLTPTIAALPPATRRLAAAQYRDPRVWLAARREWAATLREFETATPAPLAVPALVLTAGRTAEHDRIQVELHAELAALTPGGRVQVVEDAGHDTIVADARVADRITAELLALLDPERVLHDADRT